MFNIKTHHVCTIGDVSSRSFLPPLTPGSSFFAKCKRFLKKTILISELNPQSTDFFRSTTEIIEQRKKQVMGGSWIIHPFSIFRLFYEMWMAALFYTCFIFIPLEAAYHHLIWYPSSFSNFLIFGCYVDIVLNFQTGYKCPKKERIEMSRGKIARNYVFSVYFICDVVSSMPEIPELYDNDRYYLVARVFDFLALIKFIRITTYLEYSLRTFNYFRVSNVTRPLLQLAAMLVIILHYLSCLFPILGEAHSVFDGKGNLIFDSKLHLHLNDSTIPDDFFSIYVRNLYTSCSYLLGIDIDLKFKMPWSLYITAIFGYFIGKFLLTCGTVELLSLLKIENSLEIKYYSMMSQVDAYMAAKKFPLVMQKRIREYYLYKYRQKYFKEYGIRDFISDKLKKEINYHACRRLVNNVQIFKDLPQLVVENILASLKTEIYLSNDLIIKAGVEGDCMYFLASGTVVVLSPSGKEICHLEDGDYFGEICLLIGNMKRTANVIACEICEVYKLDRKAFKKSMESNKELYKKMRTEAKKRYAATKAIEKTFIKSATSLHVRM
ncbi:hypothetical protein MTP99_018106 [Tenebrio molitor]|nr:hypothetical protein MTP99_018106 [Tenebrio molitor]